ncbi:hypothetical protein B566_EDAN011327 [Ephemera danica]|nr:hypothetical protein B566_EDAN011327 [Ephemera danica]
MSTAVVAMDVEMVGTGPSGSVSVPARVAVVNSNGMVLYDTYVKPRFPVTDYRPAYNGGITARLLSHGVSFEDARERVNSLISGRILVGHDLNFDLEVEDARMAMRVYMKYIW